MEPRIDEIADRIYRISTAVPADDLPPEGFTFNQFLIDAEEPLLYHTGMRELFPAVSAAVDRTIGLDRLRWIAFSHVEADECGAVNDFLAACPNAQVTHGTTGVGRFMTDFIEREVRPWGPGDVLEIGDHALGRRVAQFETPHVPHNWEAQVIFEQETGTLFAGDLGMQLGDPPPLVEGDLTEEVVRGEEAYRCTSSLSAFLATMRSLAELSPSTVAIMHGSSFSGDGGAQLRRIADAYEERFDAEEFAASAGGVVAAPVGH